jgi:hypothetical protein
MANFPNRCQHLKVNGTQCGSPALRRNRFCYFHKRFQDESINLSADRARRGVATFVLPLLEDANSIQIALMQVMRLLVSQQMDHKTASLLLYALQTASVNLRMTKFDPWRHDVILDTRAVGETQLDEHVWSDDDFEEEEYEEEDEPEVDEAKLAADREAARKQREKQFAAARDAELAADRAKYGDPKIDPPAHVTPAMRAENEDLIENRIREQARKRPPSSAHSSASPNPAKVRAELGEQIRQSFFPNGLPDSLVQGK